MFTVEKHIPEKAEKAKTVVISHRTVGAYNVVTERYDRTYRVFAHRTLKAALRRINSVISGKLYERDQTLVVIVTPEMRVITRSEAKCIMAE